MKKRNLRIGMTGPDVLELQKSMNAQGYRLPTTGYFGKLTDGAVRGFQTRRGLVPDGIVGWRTNGALGLARRPIYPNGDTSKPDGSGGHPAGHPSNPGGRPIDPMGAASSFLRNLSDVARRIGCDFSELLESARKARKNARKPAPSHSPVQAPKPAPARPQKETPAEQRGDERLLDVKGMHISEKGKQFIYTHEALHNVSIRLHWPEGASGVTLGPGYDMKARPEQEIKSDMMAIGLDELTAKKISKASGLQGNAAKIFARDNHSLVKLTEKQEMELLNLKTPKYEQDVKKYIRVPLKQSQFDSLVSFAYNPAYEFSAVMKLINKGKIAVAMAEIKKRVKSKGKVMKSLVNRRNYEVSLYLHGDYGKLRKV